MKANLTPQEKQSMIAMVQGLDDKTLGVLWKTITTNSGGISRMDPDLLKVFYEEFKKRPGLLESLSESKKRNKLKLTESQARNAIRKWLFEYTTDSGVSHRASTDDKIAGKLGDDREDQPASTIPQETPIIATSQMSTQLTHAMPPIEDPDFIPGTVEELGRSVDLLSQQVPSSEIEWFYDKMQELADEAIDKGNKVDLTDGLMDDEMNLEKAIQPSQKSSQEAAEATNEAFKRWSKILSQGLTEAVKGGTRKDPLNLRRRKLSRGDMRLYRDGEVDFDRSFDDAVGEDNDVSSPASDSGSMTGRVGIDGKYQPSQADLDDMADEMGVELDELPGFNPNTHLTRAQRQSNLATGNFDGEAKLRELVSLGVYPKIRTMSGLRKKISAEIDPIVQMWATAKPAFLWLLGFLEDRYQCTWGSEKIAGPDIYDMAITAYEKFYRKQPAKLSQLADAIENSEFYKEAMAEIVLAPVIKKWVLEVKRGTIDVSSSKAKNNFVMSDWVLEVVLEKGFGKSGNKRRAQKLDSAMQGMQEFNDAMSMVQTVSQATEK
jgi:hypothetical protein